MTDVTFGYHMRDVCTELRITNKELLELRMTLIEQAAQLARIAAAVERSMSR